MNSIKNVLITIRTEGKQKRKTKPDYFFMSKEE